MSQISDSRRLFAMMNWLNFNDNYYFVDICLVNV